MLLQGDGRCRDQRGWGPGGAVGVPEPGDRVSAGPDQHRELLAYLAGEDDPFVELLTRGSGIEADRYRLRLPEQVSLIRAGARGPRPGAPGPRPRAGHRGGRAADLPGTRRAGMRGRRTGRPLGAGPLHRLQAPGRAGRARAGPARPGRRVAASRHGSGCTGPSAGPGGPGWPAGSGCRGWPDDWARSGPGLSLSHPPLPRIRRSRRRRRPRAVHRRIRSHPRRTGRRCSIELLARVLGAHVADETPRRHRFGRRRRDDGRH